VVFRGRLPQAETSLRVIVVLLVCLCGMAHAETRTERGYKNGRPVRIRVTQIGWADVEIATAKAFKKMAAHADRDGIDLAIRSGFRSHARQKALYRAYRQGWGNKAARPGFSNHESGRALDIDMDGGVRAWMSANAKRYGFKQTVRGEPWHWEYTPVKRAKRSIARASSTRRRS
jgi:LAS superfamily LD-carboxypeptidase LdcB